jgi:DNA (cytosine-5)-methyltransferase 1
MTKPVYRVPSMAEIAAVPWNGFTAVSTFSGCGGSSLGYKLAGFRVLWANEFIPAAQEVYRANHPGTILDTRDIRTVQPEDILDAIKLKPGQLDLFDGSPPCASFSTAGAREAGWGQVKKYSDTKQRTDDLFFEYVRLLRGIQPKTFVAENVSGLVKGTAKGYFLQILREFKACGYRVKAQVLDAQWLGVPQARQRLIFIGVRNDFNLEPVHPKPLPYRYTIRDALPSLYRESAERVTENAQAESDCGWNAVSKYARVASPDEPAPTIMTHGRGMSQVVIEAETSIERFAIGREWDKLTPGQQSDKYINLVRPSADKPSPTICAGHGHGGVAGVTHPIEKRKFSIAELKRICGFPDDFVLTGSYAQQWERLGRAVPPVMMSHIARTVRDEILSRLQK